MRNLRNQANELLYARMQVILGDWGYIDDYTEYFDDACHVILGYQELLFRILNVLEKGSWYKATTVSNVEFSIEGEELVGELRELVDKARASIIGEKGDEEESA